MSELILAINPGNTSTKIGLFRGETLVREASLRHSDAEINACTTMFGQMDLRASAVQNFLAEAQVNKGDLKSVVGRGGLLRPLPSGTYQVGSAMLADLEKAVRGEHASNLGAPLARVVAAEHGCEAYIVDPVAVDEMEPVARITGLKGVERQSLSHALNMKAVAKRHAKSLGTPYTSLRLIVVHMGSGTSLSAHREGRMVDVVNPKDEGPLSADRVGSVPATALVEMCFAPGANPKVIKKVLFGDGGLYSHLETRDARDALARAQAGEPAARLVMDGMCYQVAKFVGEMATVLEGKVDNILLTGGMAYNPPITDDIARRTQWIAPIVVYPGEDELQALVEGTLRVLRGEEQARQY